MQLRVEFNINLAKPLLNLVSTLDKVIDGETDRIDRYLCINLAKLLLNLG